MTEHLIVLNVVGLSPKQFSRPDLIPNLYRFAQRGSMRPMRPSFPAVTCSVQATLLSGKSPHEHGIIANGYFDRNTYEVKFWEQPDALVEVPRIWDLLKEKQPQLKTAVLFWQNSMFIQSDIVVTPRPLHLDSGLLQWCYSKPDKLYDQLCTQLGSFKLQSYWGPVAGITSSRWIAQAAIETWKLHRPNLSLVYFPHLDYASQKFGPESIEANLALKEIDALAGELVDHFTAQKATVIILSEYALTYVNKPIFPNRLLRDAGLLHVRVIRGKEYLDFELSDAFAMVDHQIAHIYCKPTAINAARHALEAIVPGVEFTQIDHPRSGELVAVAPVNQWFAYYWWYDSSCAPEFAFTVDIHRKPGFDPCEMWFDWKQFLKTRKLPTTATNPTLVKGSHGRVDDDPESWAVLVLDETASESCGVGHTAEATDLVPIIKKLFLGKAKTLSA